MTRFSASVALLLASVAGGCAQPDPADGDAATADQAMRPVAKTGGEDEAIPLGEVPEAVTKAAQAAVPGFTPTSAEREIEDGRTVYSLEGTAGGKECEVEVTADGKVTEIESDDAEDGDDEDGED